jgi:ribosomal protein L31E
LRINADYFSGKHAEFDEVEVKKRFNDKAWAEPGWKRGPRRVE